MHLSFGANRPPQAARPRFSGEQYTFQEDASNEPRPEKTAPSYRKTVTDRTQLKRLNRKRKIAQFFTKPVAAFSMMLAASVGSLTGLSSAASDYNEEMVGAAYSVGQQADTLSDTMQALTTQPGPTFLPGNDSSLPTLSQTQQQQLRDRLATQEFAEAFAQMNETLAPHGVANLDESTLLQAVANFTPQQQAQTRQAIQQLMTAGEDEDASVAGNRGAKLDVLMRWYDDVLAPNLVKTGMPQEKAESVRADMQKIWDKSIQDNQDFALMLLLSVFSIPGAAIGSMMLGVRAHSMEQRYRREEEALQKRQK